MLFRSGVVPFGAALGGVLARVFSLTTPFFLGGVAMLFIGLFGRRLLRPVEQALLEQRQTEHDLGN